MSKSPSRRKTNVSTNESLLDQAVTVEYNCRGKRVRKVCDDALTAKALFVKKDREGLNPKIIRAKRQATEKVKEPILIPAVAYVRKSTKGKRADGSQKQEKSLAQQRTEIIKLAAGRFKILDWFEDEGISGWKRGAQRPDFQRMLDKVKDLGAQVIVVDNIDRFSRATIDDVQQDATALRKAGVGRIVTANGSNFDLNAGQKNDLSGIIMFAAAVWAAHEYSKQLGRRMVLARCKAADDGRRTGGPLNYGWVSDGKGGLKFGDPAHVKIARWIFDTFANKGLPLNEIARQLNKVKKVPSPRGKLWGARAIGLMLRNPVYLGTFRYGKQRGGRFFTHDANGELIEAAEANGTPGKLFQQERRYPPMIDGTTFDRVQRRIARTATGRTLRKREYALSGILVCGHCNHYLHGAKLRDNVCYRCGQNSQKGKGTCGEWQVREDQLLPFLMKMLGEEVKDIQKFLTSPPPELASPRNGQAQKRQRLQQQHDKLVARIDNARESIYETDDRRTRAEISTDITKMRDDLAQLDVELATEPISKGYNRQELEALTKWWDDFTAKAVSVPVKAKNPSDSLLISFHRDLFAEDYQKDYDPKCEYVLVDPMIVNEMLRQLGAKVTLRWKTIDTGKKRTYVSRKGKRQQLPLVKHVIYKGHFQLGQQRGKLPRYVMNTMGGLRSLREEGS